MQVDNRRVIGPNPGGQTAYLARSEYEVCYAGETGSAKTWAIVYDALGLQYRHTSLGRAAYEEPSYRAVLFRRKTTELHKLIDEGRKLYSPFGAEYAGQRIGDPGPSFNFPSGSRIFCCHMKDEKNKHDHDGPEYQFVGFDELQQFSLTQYLYLHSRLRSTVPGLFVRVRSSAMPVGEGLWWVKKRFITNTTPNTTRYFIAADNPEENPRGIEVAPNHPDARSRATIEGHLQENPHVNKAEYQANVKQLGKTFERAMLKLDWDAFGGDFFKEFDPGLELIDPFQIPEGWALGASIDPGWSSYCSVGLQARDFDGTIYRIATYAEKERNAIEHAKAVLSWVETNKFTGGRMPSLWVCGKDAFHAQNRFQIQQPQATFAQVFQSYGMMVIPAITDRHNGWGTWKSLMPRNYKIFKGFNQDLVDQIISAPRDEKDVNDIKGHGDDPTVIDHSIDEQRYAVMSMYVPPAPPPAPKEHKSTHAYMVEEVMNKVGTPPPKNFQN